MIVTARQLRDILANVDDDGLVMISIIERQIIADDTQGTMYWPGKILAAKKHLVIEINGIKDAVV